MSTIHDTHTDQLVVHTCWCGIRHAIPSSLSRQAREQGRAITCPLGHEWVVKKTRVKQLEEQIQRERAQHDQTTAALRDDNSSLRDQRTKLEHQVRGQKAAKTRIKNRIAAGVCPCCNRTFQNLARHMQSKHPEYKHDHS